MVSPRARWVCAVESSSETGRSEGTSWAVEIPAVASKPAARARVEILRCMVADAVVYRSDVTQMCSAQRTMRVDGLA